VYQKYSFGIFVDVITNGEKITVLRSKFS